jgi:ABC-type phosphate transport system permease subunit
MKKISKRRKKLSTLDRVLLFCAISILVFTITMIVLFCIYQSVPDTLIVSFFGVFTGEGCICWRIWAKKKGLNINQSDGLNDL